MFGEGRHGAPSKSQYGVDGRTVLHRQSGLLITGIPGFENALDHAQFGSHGTHVCKGCWKKSLGARDAWQIAHTFGTFDADAKKERRGRIPRRGSFPEEFSQNSSHFREVIIVAPRINQ